MKGMDLESGTVVRDVHVKSVDPNDILGGFEGRTPF